jgi:hypothetical protein
MHLIRKTELCRLANSLVIRTLIGGPSIPSKFGGREPRYSGAVELLTSKSRPEALPSLEDAAWGLYGSP